MCVVDVAISVCPPQFCFSHHLPPPSFQLPRVVTFPFSSPTSPLRVLVVGVLCMHACRQLHGWEKESMKELHGPDGQLRTRFGKIYFGRLDENR